jgi:hypothetical protein
MTNEYLLASSIRRVTKNKILLNLNSDAHTNARLRDTVTNYGLRIDTKAYVLPNEKFGECRFSDLSRMIFRPVSIILLQSWPKSIKAQSIPKMEYTFRLRVQYLLDIVTLVHLQLNIHVYISNHQRASDTDETSYGAVSGEKTWTHSYIPLCVLKLSLLL